MSKKSYKTHVFVFMSGDEKESVSSNHNRGKRSSTDTPTVSPTQTSIESASTLTTTTSTSALNPEIARKMFETFYDNHDIWLYKESDGRIDGMDAFDNKKRLQANVGKLTVALVSVMGRLTPICGELWNKVAAEVFCKDAGAQLQQNWTASHVRLYDCSTLNNF